jgi:hypothetical protein
MPAPTLGTDGPKSLRERSSKRFETFPWALSAWNADRGNWSNASGDSMGNPEKEERRLLKVLAETDAKHPRFQYAFAESVTTLRI